MLRWGLLGTARINRLLIPGLRASARSQLAAVASRDESRAAKYAGEWNIPHSTTYERLLADPSIDILYVPLPNSLHAPWTIRAMEAGKHVLCEKPIALNTSEVDAIAEAASRCKRVVAEAFMYRHHAQTARIAELIAGGAVGTVRTILSAFTFFLTRNPDVRLDPALGGGCLWDVGCYPISIAQLLAGSDAVAVSGMQSLGQSGVDESFAGIVEYANGAACQFHSGFRSTYQTFLRVVGTEGVLSVPRPFRPEPIERITVEKDGRGEDFEVSGSAIFVDEVADMEDAVLGLRPSRLTLAESRRHIATIDALYRSAREGKSVRLP